MDITPVVVPKTWYVYTYAYPTGEIFYVGKGTRGRMDRHEWEAGTNCPCQKCVCIRQIWASGHPVKKRIVFESFNEDEALEEEKKTIKDNRSSLLTNVLHNSSKNYEPLIPKTAPHVFQKMSDGGFYCPMEKLNIKRPNGHTVSKSSLSGYMTYLGIQSTRFPFDRRAYIAREDVTRLQEFVEETYK